MKKVMLVAGLFWSTFNVSAACPTLDGNWAIQATPTSAALANAGLNFSSATYHISITGNAVDTAGGISSAYDFSPVVAEIGVVQSGSGTVSINPQNCRILLNVTITSTVVVNANQQNTQGQSTTKIRARGDSVKITSGYAGKYVSNSNGLVLPGRFEMARE